MNKILFTGIATLLLTLTSTNVMAKECHSVYGGGEVCEYGDLSIDKQVLNPDKGEYWDNIDSSDYVFGPDQEITFKIRVKNISDVRLDNVLVRDYMTNYLKFVRANNANWLSDQGKAEWGIGDLEPGESQTVYITFKTFTKDNLPSEITCETNTADVEKDNGNRKSDSSSFCISKTTTKPLVLGAKMPDTGVDMPTMIALELIVLGGIGMAYVVKASKNS